MSTHQNHRQHRDHHHQINEDESSDRLWSPLNSRSFYIHRSDDGITPEPLLDYTAPRNSWTPLKNISTETPQQPWPLRQQQHEVLPPHGQWTALPPNSPSSIPRTGHLVKHPKKVTPRTEHRVKRPEIVTPKTAHRTKRPEKAISRKTLQISQPLLGTRRTVRNDEEEKDPDLVDWDGPKDPEKPSNWPDGKKLVITIVLGLMTFVSAFGSSVYSAGIFAVKDEFGVSEEVALLGITLYVVGFAVGPLIWGPWSEISGRRLPLFMGYALFAAMNVVVAVGQNIQTVLVFRFFAGATTACTYGIAGGILVDIYYSTARGVMSCITFGAIFAGPVLGPIAGGFIMESRLGWRFTNWLTFSMAVIFGVTGFFCIPESLGSIILHRRAQKIRYETKQWSAHSSLEEKPLDFNYILTTYYMKPPKMMIREPILVLMTIYMSLIYGILYLTFEAYPISFQFQRGWSQGVGTLPFLSLFVGIILAILGIILYGIGPGARRLKASKLPVLPELRLPPMIVGGVLLPMGLFWFAWTSNPKIQWVPQVLSGIPIGAGMALILIQGLAYLVDCYLLSANSALAGSACIRSIVGSGFPLFAKFMFTSLGLPWATSVLGFICVGMIPIPIVFYVYGRRIRKWSKFSYDIGG